MGGSHGVSAYSCTVCGLCQGIPTAKRMSGDIQPALHSQEACPGTGLRLSREVGAPFSNLHKALLWTSCESDENYCIKSSDISKGIIAPHLRIRKTRLEKLE